MVLGSQNNIYICIIYIYYLYIYILCILIYIYICMCVCRYSIYPLRTYYAYPKHIKLFQHSVPSSTNDVSRRTSMIKLSRNYPSGFGCRLHHWWLKSCHVLAIFGLSENMIPWYPIPLVHHHTLWETHSSLLKKWPFCIVDLPSYKMVIFHSIPYLCNSLPEGNCPQMAITTATGLGHRSQSPGFGISPGFQPAEQYMVI